MLSVTERHVSQVEDADKLVELIMTFSENAPTPEREKKAVDMNDVREDWGKCSEEWDIRNENLRNTVGDFYLGGNLELEEEKKVNKAIGERLLANLPYNLSQRSGKYSRERRHEIEREMHPTSKGAPEEETYN